MATTANRFEHRTNAIDRLGRTVVYAGELLRHPVYTRFLHWMVGFFFFFALLSGFGIYLPWIFRFFTPLFGGGATTRLLHPWFGLGFVMEDRVTRQLADGSLVRVLENWCPPFPGYHLYYPSRRHASPAFAMLLDVLRYRG